jgi:hypothetical protein
MSGLFGQSEKVNNVLFVVILTLAVLLLVFIKKIDSDLLFLSLALLFFSSIIYGYVSNRPKKAFLLAFLVWSIFLLCKIIVLFTEVSLI